MRVLLLILLLPALAAGCTPYIPVRDDFGASALVATGDIPPEYAEFNAYDPRVNVLLTDQLCATPYQPLEDHAIAASSGRLIQARGRCQNHIPLWGP